MKKLFFLSVLFAFIFSSCGSDEGFVAMEDNSNDNVFMELVAQDAYPTNQLSEESIQHFNENLVFNEEGRIISGDYSKVQDELGVEGLQTLLKEILGENLVIEDEENILSTDQTVAGKCAYAVYANKKKINGDCFNTVGGFCVIVICDGPLDDPID